MKNYIPIVFIMGFSILFYVVPTSIQEGIRATNAANSEEPEDAARQNQVPIVVDEILQHQSIIFSPASCNNAELLQQILREQQDKISLKPFYLIKHLKLL